MAWDFSTDPEYQKKLDWVEEFVREKVEPLEHVDFHAFDMSSPLRQRLIPPLQEEVREQGLWACHLGPELGGPGYGQVQLALLNEIIGQTRWGPIVFGAQAPDSGNAEILAHYGTSQQKERYLEPLLANDIVSCFAMTEPQGGADPLMMETTARLENDEWVISGEKWFVSNARFASFLIVMALTDPQAPKAHDRISALLVDATTPGIEFVRHVAYGGEPADDGDHAYVRFNHVRVPRDNLLGERGQGFVVAQTRLGGGRVHHAMRTVGQVRLAFDMMCERALSRETRGESLAAKQLTQAAIAESWIKLESFRLLVLRTAARIDELNDYRRVRGDIAAVKAAMPTVLQEVVLAAMRLHGSLGVSTEMPFKYLLDEAVALSLGDGPTEVHLVTLAREVLKGYEPAPDMWPSRHLPRRREHAARLYPDLVDAVVGDRS
ncbi:acyl-CoA dehydrogenase family protein [Georgenia sp. SYP-B2076]|uniref:acyl-CoA dehydrogenase family protein n=1 Tax=Georgenia sp. SYP-B2076 TaxID=2495881 RepID=UPI000F8F6597|nr:acyl-CoA dehydrogenase family protein [Georgenia sp. SYP-B2076]